MTETDVTEVWAPKESRRARNSAVLFGMSLPFGDSAVLYHSAAEYADRQTPTTNCKSQSGCWRILQILVSYSPSYFFVCCNTSGFVQVKGSQEMTMK